MPLNRQCFRDCVKSRVKWYAWVSYVAVAVGLFLLALLSWGLLLPAAIAWAVGGFAASIGLAFGTCYLSCS